MSRGRKRRKAAAAALASGGVVTSPVLLPSWDRCHPLGAWEPDLDNAHLQVAARGLASIGVPLHAPAPITFSAPGGCRG